MRVSTLDVTLLSFTLISVVSSTKLETANDVIPNVDSPDLMLLDTTVDHPFRPLAVDSTIHSTQPLFRLHKRAPMDGPRESAMHHDASMQVDEPMGHHESSAAHEKEIKKAWEKVDRHNSRLIAMINDGSRQDDLLEQERIFEAAKAKHRALKLGDAEAAKHVREYYNDIVNSFFIHAMGGYYTRDHPAAPLIEKYREKIRRWNGIYSRLKQRGSVNPSQGSSSTSRSDSGSEMEVDEEGSSSVPGLSNRSHGLQVNEPGAVQGDASTRHIEDLETANRKMVASYNQLKETPKSGDPELRRKARDKYSLSATKYKALSKKDSRYTSRVLRHYRAKVKDAKLAMEENVENPDQEQRIAYFNKQDKKLKDWQQVHHGLGVQMRQRQLRMTRNEPHTVNSGARRTGSGEYLYKRSTVNLHEKTTLDTPLVGNPTLNKGKKVEETTATNDFSWNQPVRDSHIKDMDVLRYQTSITKKVLADTFARLSAKQLSMIDRKKANMNVNHGMLQHNMPLAKVQNEHNPSIERSIHSEQHANSANHLLNYPLEIQPNKDSPKLKEKWQHGYKRPDVKQLKQALDENEASFKYLDDAKYIGELSKAERKYIKQKAQYLALTNRNPVFSERVMEHYYRKAKQVEDDKMNGGFKYGNEQHFPEFLRKLEKVNSWEERYRKLKTGQTSQDYKKYHSEVPRLLKRAPMKSDDAGSSESSKKATMYKGYELSVEGLSDRLRNRRPRYQYPPRPPSFSEWLPETGPSEKYIIPSVEKLQANLQEKKKALEEAEMTHLADDVAFHKYNVEIAEAKLKAERDGDLASAEKVVKHYYGKTNEAHENEMTDDFDAKQSSLPEFRKYLGKTNTWKNRVKQLSEPMSPS